MCWNPSVSLTSFLITVVMLITVAEYLTRHPHQSIVQVDRAKYPIFAFAILSFAGIQLVEYMLWTAQASDPASMHKNYVWSIIAFLLVMIQPLAGMLFFWEAWAAYRVWLLGAYVLFVLSVASRWSTYHFQSAPGPNGHLHWKWMKWRPLEFACYFGLALLPILLAKDWVTFAFMTVTLLVSTFFYWQGSSVGTMWCWSVNLISVYYLYHLIQKDKGGCFHV